MQNSICNTSPILYLYRIDALAWLPILFNEIWIPNAVIRELDEGAKKGYSVPKTNDYDWLQVVDPSSIPSSLSRADLGMGEINAIALALENPDRIVLLDDGLARRVAKEKGLSVRGTLKVVLEAKNRGLIDSIAPCIDRLQLSGMWISGEIRQRVLALAGE